MTRLLIALLALTAGACTKKLPVCSPELVASEEWSRPCRSADEQDSETGALDRPDPSDLGAAQ